MRKIVDKLDMEKVLELYERPLPTAEVGRLMGCSRSTIDRALRTIGRLRKVNRVGVLSGQWKGGRYRMSNGYIALQVGVKLYRLEHRVVMEKKLGRKLREDEVVHHINRDRADNRPENLELQESNSEHMRQHHRKYPQQDRMVDLYLQGFSPKMVADIIGCSPNVIRQAVMLVGKLRTRKESLMLRDARHAVS